MNIATRPFSAASWIAVANIIKSVLYVTQLGALTRFLSPQDFGFMALVVVITSYLALFSDMGLSTAFIQRQHITLEERSSLFWLSVTIGFSLMLVVMAISPLVARFYNQDELAPLLMLASTNFLIIPLGQQLRADAEKRLDFKPVAIIEIGAMLFGFSIAILTAWKGYGVYSLTLAAVGNTCANTILSWMLLANKWRPLWRMRLNEISWFVQFGGGMLVNNLINQINSTIDIFMGGRIMSASSLGLYSVPRNLIFQIQSMINPIFTRITFPIMAKIQSDPHQIRTVYLTILNLTATINAPIYIGIAAFSPELVQLMFGPNFANTAQLMQVLAIWGLLRSFFNPLGCLLYGLGKLRLAMLWNIFLLFIVPPALWLGMQFGVLGLAWTMSILMFVLFVPSWIFLIRPCCPITLWDYIKQVLQPSICAVLAAVFTSLAVNNFDNIFLKLGLAVAIGSILYLFVSMIFNKSPFHELAKIINS